MAKQAQTGKQKAAEAKNEEERKKAGKAPAKAVTIVPIAAKALSRDVGPKAIAALSRAKDDEDKALKVLDGVATTRYDIIANVTMAIVKAAKIDKNIDLAVSFSGDKKKMNELQNQLGIVLGTREIKSTQDGTNVMQRVVHSDAVAKLFNSAGDKKDSPEYARKETLRNNWVTLVKRGAQAACGIIDNDLTATHDKKGGTLRISGPAIKANFGADSVLLNENTKQGGDKPLTAKPSFTAIRALGGAKHDAAVPRKSNTRGKTTSTPKPVDPDTAFQAIAGQLLMAIGKFSGPLEGKTKEAAEMVKNAVTTKLAEHGESKLIPKK